MRPCKNCERSSAMLRVRLEKIEEELMNYKFIASIQYSAIDKMSRQMHKIKYYVLQAAGHHDKEIQEKIIKMIDDTVKET